MIYHIYDEITKRVYYVNCTEMQLNGIGIDEKEENIRNMVEARAIAKKYLSDGYDEVFVLSETKIQRVFDLKHKNGRKPYHCDYEDFRF